MKKVVSFMLAVVAIVCLMSCGGNQAKMNSESAVQIDIPRTHWGITLGDTRSAVNKRLASVGVERDNEEATDLTYVFFESLNNDEEEKRFNRDMIWDVIRPIEKNELFQVSIYWYSDKVAAIKIFPYDDEIISESVQEKYSLNGCGSYSLGSLVDFSFSKYSNDSTTIIMVKRTQNYKYSFEKEDPKPSYQFIYVDRNLMDKRMSERSTKIEDADRKRRQVIENKKSTY